MLLCMMPAMPNYIFRGESADMQQPAQNAGQQISQVNNVQQMGTQEMQADVQDIINMFEQHHPDIMSTLTDCGMSTNEARQYLSGIIMIIVGCVYKLYPPKHINHSLGYRTPFAMKNIDTWE